ncbi:MAG TPA: IPT/TIG domain-containing protein [Polyangia bacterium]|jgi:hypothetical protein|nr:IPT/TIG domain-containing protein [Polyangia bacterium]
MARRCLLLALLLAACNDSRNYVVVSVAGISNYNAVTSLHVDVANNSNTAAVDVPVPTGSRPPDPFTFSLGFDAARAGQVGIGLEARNSSGAPLARGDAIATLAKGVVEASLTLERLPSPSVNNLSPINCHYPTGGAQIFINGADFLSSSVVEWGFANPIATTFISTSQLRVTTPPGNDGQTVDVYVRNPDRQLSNSVQFYYRFDLLNCP